MKRSRESERGRSRDQPHRVPHTGRPAAAALLRGTARRGVPRRRAPAAARRGVLLVFFEASAAGIAEDPDEIAFDVDEDGFAETLANARRMGVLRSDPVDHTAWSRGFVVHDPDGRRLEIVYEDRAVFWRG